MDFRRKMIKGISNRVTYMTTSTFWKLVQQSNSKNATCGPFSTKPRVPLVGKNKYWQRLFCLNVCLRYIRQKIKFNWYLTNHQNWLFFMARSHPQVPSVKMTDPSASYTCNGNFNVKCCNRMSVLRKPLVQNRWN